MTSLSQVYQVQWIVVPTKLAILVGLRNKPVIENGSMRVVPQL